MKEQVNIGLALITEPRCVYCLKMVRGFVAKKGLGLFNEILIFFVMYIVGVQRKQYSIAIFEANYLNFNLYLLLLLGFTEFKILDLYSHFVLCK